MSLTKPRNPLRVAVVIGALLVVVNIAIWGGRSQRNGAANPQRPVEIQQLFPNESDLLLPQGTVGADLRDQFTGQITVDGVLIPADQTTAGSPLGVVTFDPGPGKVFTEWSQRRALRDDRMVAQDDHDTGAGRQGTAAPALHLGVQRRVTNPNSASNESSSSTVTPSSSALVSFEPGLSPATT